MRWLLLGTVAACLLIPALAQGESAPAVRYEVTYTGLMYITHSDTGTSANGGDCSADPQLPFQDSYTVKLAWDDRFAFAYHPGAGTSGVVRARTTSVNGSHFSFSGFFYNQTCQKVSYAAGGKACIGTLVNHGKALLIARLKTVGAIERLRFAFQPFGELTGSPSGCPDDDSPPVTYTAEQEMGLSGLVDDFTSHAFGLAEHWAHGVDKQGKYTLSVADNCSQPGQDDGDTDTCSTRTTGNAFLDIHPLGS